jgi:hypothetical protein
MAESRTSNRQGRNSFNSSSGIFQPGVSEKWVYGDKTQKSSSQLFYDQNDFYKKNTGWNFIKSQNARVAAGWTADSRAGRDVTSNLIGSKKIPKSNENQWWTFYESDGDIRGYQTSRILEKVQDAKAPFLKRESLIIDKNREGKSDLVADANKPVQITAEDVLKRRLAMIRMKGRASMPSAGGTSKDEPTVNISSGGAMGLNFA